MQIRIKNLEFRIQNWLLLFCILHSAFCITKAHAQSGVSDPYSRYGMGDLQTGGFARNQGMGGLGIGVSSTYNINPINPASYASFGLTTFEGALQGNVTSLDAAGVRSTSASTSFGYFAFGFPIKAGKWGLSFGLLPFSNANYNISDVESTTDLGNANYNYQGSGDINQFYIGTGYSLFKNFRLGVNASYLFGTIDETKTVTLPANPYYLNSQITNSTTVNDFHFTFGLQWTLDSLKVSPTDSIVMYRRQINTLHDQIKARKDSVSQFRKRISGHAELAEQLKGTITTEEDSISSLNRQIDAQKKLKGNVDRRKIKRDWSFTLGGNFSLATNLRASQSTLAQLYTLTSDGFQTIRDTAENTGAVSGSIKLPLMAGVGITAKKGNKWLFGADASVQNWSSFTSFGVTDSLVNSMLYTIGAQYTPDERSISSVFKIIQYRLGFHYDQTYLNLRNTGLNDYGVSFGVGVPLRKTLSVIQVAFEIGRMGTTVNQLVEATYFRFVIGLSLSDVWFLKPRID